MKGGSIMTINVDHRTATVNGINIHYVVRVKERR
jgi:hypothetical protein